MKGEVVLATFVLGLVLSFVERPRPSESPSRKWSCLVGPIAWIVVAYLVATRLVTSPNYLDFTAIGAIAAVVLAWLRPGIVAGPVMIAASCASAHEWSVAVDPMGRVAWVWLIGGIVACLGLVAGQRSSSLAFGLCAALASAANAWVPDGLLNVSHQYGTFMAIFVAFGLLVSNLADKEGSRPIVTWASVLAVPIGSFVLSQWGGHGTAPTVLVVMATLLAAASAYMFGDNPPSWRLLLVGLGWTAFATYAYSDQRAFGLSLAALAGAATYLLLGQVGRIATMAPLLALAFYRTFRAGHPDAVKAFDIAQHYALVGLILALGTVLLLAQLGARIAVIESLAKKFTAMVATAALVVAGSLFATVFLGDKGSVGLVVGFGLAPLFAVASGQGGRGSVAVSIALSGAVSFGMAFLPDTSEIGRDAKLTMFWIAIAVAVALALLAGWAVAPTKEPQSVEQ